MIKVKTYTYYCCCMWQVMMSGCWLVVSLCIWMFVVYYSSLYAYLLLARQFISLRVPMNVHSIDSWKRKEEKTKSNERAARIRLHSIWYKYRKLYYYSFHKFRKVYKSKSTVKNDKQIHKATTMLCRMSNNNKW